MESISLPALHELKITAAVTIFRVRDVVIMCLGLGFKGLEFTGDVALKGSSADIQTGQSVLKIESVPLRFSSAKLGIACVLRD